MKKLIVIPVLLFVSLVAQAQPNFRAPRNTRVVLLQQVPDSIQVEVSWSHSTPRSLVKGYIVSIETPSWILSDTVPSDQNADSLWLHRDTVDVSVEFRIIALTDGDPVASPLSTFTIPASTVVTAPGNVQVKIITSIGMYPDSISLAGLERYDTIPSIGDSIHFLPIGWFGKISMVCGSLDTGNRGWIQVEPKASAQPYGWYMTDGGAFIPDSGCGWQNSYSTDRNIADVTFSDIGITL